MENALENQQVWTGTGEHFPHLEVRHLMNNDYRVSASGKGEYQDETTIIEAQSLEEAIAYIQDFDYKFYDEATLYADEG